LVGEDKAERAGAPLPRSDGPEIAVGENAIRLAVRSSM
jgi:hypothetical protein